MLEVLYEDNHLIAVSKPAGMLVQGDETGDVCLMDEVRKYLKDKYQKQGNVFLGLLHRLDRPVAGIVLFARTSKGASRLSEQIRTHKVKKVYHALVAGRPPMRGTLINYIEKNEKTNHVTVYDTEHVGAFYAELDYELVESKGDTSLVKINLKTGRSHQIRAQFSHIGHPLVGDSKYGSKIPYHSGTIALCASELSFETATTGEWKTIKKEVDL
jgi:23S rRNA pseudouridine1911/1915/1917 synthase